jgi:hypothetical protein
MYKSLLVLAFTINEIDFEEPPAMKFEITTSEINYL